jgi:hypothetical protein
VLAHKSDFTVGPDEGGFVQHAGFPSTS